MKLARTKMGFPLIFAVGCMAFGASAMAQAAAAPAPAATPDDTQPAAFPALPPSRKCTKRDITGIWALKNVYEMPQDAETNDFSRNPKQYIFMRQNSTFGKITGQTPYAVADIRKKLNQQQTPLRQFVMDDKSGFIFFYQAGVATDTQACFIVSEASGDFVPGQMLLMPPQGQSKGRMVKQYAKLKGGKAGGKENGIPAKLRKGKKHRANANADAEY